jgi:hypothetical protein
MRLSEHIFYAAEHGVLDDVDRYLRGLEPEKWLYEDGNPHPRPLSRNGRGGGGVDYGTANLSSESMALLLYQGKKYWVES